MKYFTIIALAAVAFGLGACAKKETSSGTYSASTGSTTSYSK